MERIKRTHRHCNKQHEGVNPQYTPDERKRMKLDDKYGGITGTVSPSSFFRLFESIDLRPGDIFCDVGSGQGRPTMSMALPHIKASLGFDIDPLQVYNSSVCLAGFLLPSSPIGFFVQDAFELDSLEPVTIAYAFVGFPAMLDRILKLAANTSTLRMLILVTTSKDTIHPEETKLHGIKIGTYSYTGHIIQYNTTEKETVQKQRDLVEKVDLVLTKEGRSRLLQEGLNLLN
jgi:hypothetical protein